MYTNRRKIFRIVGTMRDGVTYLACGGRMTDEEARRNLEIVKKTDEEAVKFVVKVCDDDGMKEGVSRVWIRRAD